MMQSQAAIWIGILLLMLASAGFVIPITKGGHTAMQANDVCSNDMAQFDVLFGEDAPEACSQYQLLSYAVYGLMIGGIILIVIGVILRGKLEFE